MVAPSLCALVVGILATTTATGYARPMAPSTAGRIYDKRATILGTLITSQAQVDQNLQIALSVGAEAVAGVLEQIVPRPGPTAIAQAQKEISSILTANVNDTIKSAADLLLNGLAGGDLTSIINAYAVESGTQNSNTQEPSSAIYPKADDSDAPYSVSEEQLRQAIYIPPSFSFGAKAIAIFLPGTASVAGQTFGPNIAKLLVANNVADPVYVNIPNSNLDDIQVNAEYVAYAVNYISGISGDANVTTISWSAGSLDGQWALKYWPSTRSKMSNKIGISADYHGTVLAELLCSGLTGNCTPAVAQQFYSTNFINTLRNNGGDSAYVPTTNVYSIFDEVVQPQSDPNASSSLNDARQVGVSNIELQASCTALLPGGAINNDHEGVLYNALAYRLVVDAIQNNGPAQLSRVDAAVECAKYAADGLSVDDVLATHALIVSAVYDIAQYTGTTYSTEPAIMAYAAADTPND